MFFEIFHEKATHNPKDMACFLYIKYGIQLHLICSRSIKNK